MRAGIVDGDDIAQFDLRQRAGDGEFIIVFAQRTHHIIDVIGGGVLPAQHRDVVVGAVHRGTHEIYRARVEPDVFAVDVLFMNRRGDQKPVRAGDVSAQLRCDVRMPKPGGRHDFGKRMANFRADCADIGRFLLRMVGDAHAAGQVYHEDIRAQRDMQIARQRKQNARVFGIVMRLQRVARQQRMQTEGFYAARCKNAHGFEDLIAGHAVFGFFGMPHAGFADIQIPAGIVAQADLFRQSAVRGEKINVGNIIQIDDRVHAAGFFVFFGQRFVGREHDFISGKARRARQHQLRNGRAVHTAAFLAQNFQDERIRARLYGVVFAKARVPRKRAIHVSGACANARFIVEMKRRGITIDDALNLRKRYEGQFAHKYSPLRVSIFNLAISYTCFSLSSITSDNT